MPKSTKANMNSKRLSKHALFGSWAPDAMLFQDVTFCHQFGTISWGSLSSKGTNSSFFLQQVTDPWRQAKPCGTWLWLWPFCPACSTVSMAPWMIPGRPLRGRTRPYGHMPRRPPSTDSEQSILLLSATTSREEGRPPATSFTHIGSGHPHSNHLIPERIQPPSFQRTSQESPGITSQFCFRSLSGLRSLAALA